MKRWYIALIAVSAMAIAGLAAAEADSSEADSNPLPKCTFNFTVVDVNDKGIKGVTVHFAKKINNANNPLEITEIEGTTDGKGKVSLSYSPNSIEEWYIAFKRSGYTVSKVEGPTTMTRWAIIDGEFVNTDVGHTIAGGDLIALSNINPPAEQSEENITVTMIATTFTTTLRDSDGNGLSDVGIEAEDIFGKNEEIYRTKNDGSFTIDLRSNYGTKLRINMTGYTAIEVIPYMTIGTDNGSYINIDISGKYRDAGIPWSTLKNNSKQDDLISYYYPGSIVMCKTNGYLSVQVQMSDKIPIVGADVTVVNKDTGVFLIESTDSDGFAKFNVSTGYYYFKVSVGGFEDYDSRENGDDDVSGYHYVSVGQPASVISTLKEKSSPTYFGLSTGHTLMIAGIVIGIILALLSCLLYTRRLHSDLEENEN